MTSPCYYALRVGPKHFIYRDFHNTILSSVTPRLSYRASSHIGYTRIEAWKMLAKIKGKRVGDLRENKQYLIETAEFIEL